MSRLVGRLTLALLLLLCASFCLTQLSEADFHWHLLTGERILEERSVPRADFFTFSSAGRSWIDLHWLFQILVATVHRTAGFAGLDALKIALIVGAFALLLLAALRRGARPGPLGALGLVAVVAAQERFTLRPEALSFFLLALTLLILGERRRHPRLLLLIPAILLIWANSHALFMVGVIVLLLVTAGDLVDARRRAASSARFLLGIDLAGIAATMVTPYGPAGWALPWKLFFERVAADNIYGRHIAEFQPPFGGYGPTACIVAFGLLIVAAAAAMWAGRNATSTADLLVCLGLLGPALLARRNIPLFAFAAVPCVAPSLEATLVKLRGRLLPPGAGSSTAGRLAAGVAGLVVPAVILLGLADVWSNRFFERDGTQRYFGRGAAPGFYPMGAADFVLRTKPPGEVIHDMTMGGYLAWRWYPERRTFIDGRLEVHDTSLFSTCLRLQGDPGLFEETARAYGVDTVLWSHRHSPEAAALLRYLAEGHGWRPVFVDLAAVVFTRLPDDRGPRTIDLQDPGLGREILEQVRRAETASAGLDPIPSFVRRRLPRREVPVAAVNAALFFGVVGSYTIAERLFKEALEVAPENAMIHYDLGLMLDRAGRSEEARRQLEAAIQCDETLSIAREGLALGLAKQGDEQKALREWAEAETMAPLSGPSLMARGAILARRGRVDEAIEDYRRAVGVLPRDASLRAELALLYQRRGLRQQATEEIQRALALSPQGCASLTALGRIRASEGREEEARQALRRALDSGDGPCPEAAQAMQEIDASRAAPR